MNKLLSTAFLTAALAACNGAPPDATATAAAATASHAASAAGSAAARADAKAAEVVSTIGSLLHGGDVNGHYVLGEALPLHYVHADALAACGRGCAPEALLGAAHDRIYPVSLDGRVVGSITLHEVDGAWQVAAIGQGAASGQLAAARAQLRQSVHADDDAFAVVHVIGPNLRLLAHREQAALRLTSLAEGEPRAPRAAADVFAHIAARAQ